MKKLSVLVLFFVMAVAAWAVPARKTGVVVTQPDGSEMIVYQHGDEHFHWQTNDKLLVLHVSTTPYALPRFAPRSRHPSRDKNHQRPTSATHPYHWFANENVRHRADTQ